MKVTKSKEYDASSLYKILFVIQPRHISRDNRYGESLLNAGHGLYRSQEFVHPFLIQKKYHLSSRTSQTLQRKKGTKGSTIATRMITTISNSSRCFFDFPPEVRNMTYDFLDPSCDCAVSGTCKSVRKEGLSTKVRIEVGYDVDIHGVYQVPQCLRATSAIRDVHLRFLVGGDNYGLTDYGLIRYFGGSGIIRESC